MSPRSDFPHRSLRSTMLQLAGTLRIMSKNYKNLNNPDKADAYASCANFIEKELNKHGEQHD